MALKKNFEKSSLKKNDALAIIYKLIVKQSFIKRRLIIK